MTKRFLIALSTITFFAAINASRADDGDSFGIDTPAFAAEAKIANFTAAKAKDLQLELIRHMEADIRLASAGLDRNAMVAGAPAPAAKLKLVVASRVK